MNSKHFALGIALSATTFACFAGFASAASSGPTVAPAPILRQGTLVQRVVPNAATVLPRTDRFAPPLTEFPDYTGSVLRVAAEVAHAVTNTWMRPGVSTPAGGGLVELGRYDR
jgi:hypothetical protein